MTGLQLFWFIIVGVLFSGFFFIMSLLNIRLIRLMASKLLMLRFRLELWP